MSDVLGDLRLGNHQVEDLYTVLPQPADTGLDIDQNLLDNGKEESVVDLVDGVVRTENPATSGLGLVSSKSSRSFTLSFL